MSNSSNPVGWALVKDRIAYTGKGQEALLLALRKVLADNPYTQSFMCRVGKPYIDIEKLVKPDDVPEPVSFHECLRNRKMEEYAVDKEKSPYIALWEMFEIIHAEGLEVSHIAVGNKDDFQKWVGVRIKRNQMQLFGVPIVHVGDLPQDIFVLCGSQTKEATPEEIEFSVKGTIL